MPVISRVTYRSCLTDRTCCTLILNPLADAAITGFRINCHRC
jgi:hypothetical protein